MSTDGDDDLVGTAVIPVVPHPTAPLSKRTLFLPWHKPRKHFVRVYQWCAQARKLVHQRKPYFRTRPLSYLTLPGEDLLDVRALHDAFLRDKVRMRYLGFNPQRTTEVALSQVEVGGLELVDAENSFILEDRFEALGLQNSVAFKRALEFAPFDIVNLDLCASAASAHPDDERTVFKAILNVLSLQEAQGGAWLLFLTTRADIAATNADALKLLLGHVIGNANAHAAFQAALETDLSINRSDLDAPSGMDPENFARAFGLAVGKWLLSTANGAGSAWDVELFSDNYWYSVAGANRDMLSLSFRFSRKRTVADKSGLSGAVGAISDTVQNELQLALGMVGKLSSMADPDQIMRSDSERERRVIEKSRRLLEKARYDGEAYMRWLADEQTLPTSPVS